MSVLTNTVLPDTREKNDESSLTDNGIQSPVEEVIDGGYGVSNT